MTDMEWNNVTEAEEVEFDIDNTEGMYSELTKFNEFDSSEVEISSHIRFEELSGLSQLEEFTEDYPTQALHLWMNPTFKW